MTNNKLFAIFFILALLCIAAVSAEDICIDNTAPSAPGSLTITESPFDADGRITLDWDAATDEPGEGCPGVAYYEVFRMDSDTSGFVKVGQTSALSFEQEGLTDGTTYTYKVRAVDSVVPTAHRGEFSNEASTTIGTGPYCGDNVCNGDETCSSCSDDCGTCRRGGGGGSSPSSTSTVTTTTTTSSNSDNETVDDTDDEQEEQDDTSSDVVIQTTNAGEEQEDDENNPPSFQEQALGNRLTGAVTGGGSGGWGWLIFLVLFLVGLFLVVFSIRRMRR